MAVVAPVIARPKEFASHPFWDRENRVLFAAAGAPGGGLLHYPNLADGGGELNRVTRMFSGSTAGLAANFGSKPRARSASATCSTRPVTTSWSGLHHSSTLATQPAPWRIA